jgi:hypothetical protein
MTQRILLSAVMLLTITAAFGQASVAYYPFNSILSISSNPNRAAWLDARVQTGTPLGSFNTTVVPMVNFIRKPTVSYYAGLGVNLNPLTGINGERFVKGYSAHVGVRFMPVAFLPRFRVALEVSPYTQSNFKFGNLYSYLGLVYQFEKKK